MNLEERETIVDRINRLSETVQAINTDDELKAIYEDLDALQKSFSAKSSYDKWLLMGLLYGRIIQLDVDYDSDYLAYEITADISVLQEDAENFL